MTAVVAVLGYHKIGQPPPGGWQTWNYVDAETFLAQLQVVRDSSFEVIDHARLLGALAGAEGLPQRAVLLTFDDGYRSTLTEAAPRLQDFGYPGVVFVPTKHIGTSNVWDQDSEPPEPLCGWRELAELETLDVSVQSHAVTHTTFGALSPEQVRDEVGQSKDVLEQGLGRPVTSLAYPYGDAGRIEHTAGALADAGYRAAFLYGGGSQRIPTAAPFELVRVAVGPDTDIAEQLRRAEVLLTKESA